MLGSLRMPGIVSCPIRNAKLPLYMWAYMSKTKAESERQNEREHWLNEWGIKYGKYLKRGARDKRYQKKGEEEDNRKMCCGRCVGVLLPAQTTLLQITFTKTISFLCPFVLKLKTIIERNHLVPILLRTQKLFNQKVRFKRFFLSFILTFSANGAPMQQAYFDFFNNPARLSCDTSFCLVCRVIPVITARMSGNTFYTKTITA